MQTITKIDDATILVKDASGNYSVVLIASLPQAVQEAQAQISQLTDVLASQNASLALLQDQLAQATALGMTIPTN